MAADGSIVIQVDLDTDNAEKEYSKLKTQIKRTADEINDLQQKKTPLVEQAEQLRQRLKAAQAEADRFGEQWQQGVIGADQKQTEALETVRDLEYQYEQIVKQIDKIDEKLLPNIQKYERMTNEAGELRKEISQTAKNTDKAAKNAEKMGKAVQKASRQAQTFSQRMKNLLRQVIEFGIIFGAYGAFTNWLWTAVKANDEAAASMARFKAATLTAVQPLLNVLIPAFSQLVNVATQVMAVFARLTAAIFGTTVEESADAAEGLWNEQNAIEGVGEAAKKTTKQLAAFDEINKLMGDTSSSASTPEVNIKDPIVPDFSGIKDIKLPEWLENIVTKIEATISDIRFELSDGFSLDDDTTLTTVLSTALGAFIGGTVTRSGGGLLLGAALGFLASIFLDEFKKDDDNTGASAENFDDTITQVLKDFFVGTAIFRSFKGGVLTAAFGLIGRLWNKNFAVEEGAENDANNTFDTVVGTILKAVIGAGVYKSFGGGALGISMGLTAALTSTGFINGLTGGGEGNDGGFWQVTNDIFDALIGATVFTGFAKGTTGKLIGLSLGLTAALAEANIVEGEDGKRGLDTNFWLYLLPGILGALIGGTFGGVMGGVIGMNLGLGVSLIASSIADNVPKETFTKIKNTVNWILSGIIFGMIGAAIGGTPIGIAAGIVTIGLGLLIEWFSVESDISGTPAGNTLADLSDNMYHASGGLVGKAAETPQNASTRAAKNTGYVAVNMDDIPFMASGGVIPPNRSFLAVLGDQTRGTNIEAPLDTIVQAMQIALANGNGGKNEAVFEVDGNTFARLVYKYANRENNRIGVSLAGGMA